MEDNNQNKIQIAMFFPSDGMLGGAERRLSRILKGITQIDSNIKADVLVHSLVEPDGVERQFKNIVGEQINVFVFRKKIKLIQHILKTKYTWVCYTDCYFRSYVAVIPAFLSHKKRMVINVSYSKLFKTYHDGLKGFIKRMAYINLVFLSNHMDSLYPGEAIKLREMFTRKVITITPGAFTDYDIFCPATNKEKWIIFSARLDREKGVLLFLKGIELAQEAIRHYGYCCYIYGDGELSEAVKKTIETMRCEDIIKVKGYVADTSKILAKSRIFCSLQVMENYPSQSLIEALACGAYCIATDVGDTKLMIDESFGVLIPNEGNKLSDALIEAMVFDDNKYMNVAKAAREYSIMHFSLENSVRHYRKLFLENIDEHVSEEI